MGCEKCNGMGFTYDMLYNAVWCDCKGTSITLKPEQKKCECGSDTVGHPGHSVWCAKWEKHE